MASSNYLPIIPVSTVAGTYYVGVLLDISDANNNNNASNYKESTQIIVTGANPSLLATPLTIDLGTGKAGTEFSNEITIKNIGAGNLNGNITKNVDWITSINSTTFSLNGSESKNITIEGVFPSDSNFFSTDIEVNSNDKYSFNNSLNYL